MLYGYEYISKNESRRKRILRRRVKKTVFSIVIILCVFYAAGFVIQRVRHRNSQTIVSPLAESFNASVNVFKQILAPSRLGDVVGKSLEGAQGTYAVAVKNLETGETYYLNENREFESASLYKLWVMGAAYNQIERKKLDQNKTLTRDIVELNAEYGVSSESAELTEGTFELSVKDAINQMIVISNNYAALALSDEVGSANISNFLTNYNFNYSHFRDPPTTTAEDIALFFEKLYGNQLASEKTTREMIGILQNQQLNDRIPKYLPQEIVAGHKTGELDKFKHDAGIVFTSKGDYVLVVLSETDNPDDAAEHIAKLSKDIFEYFDKR